MSSVQDIERAIDGLPPGDFLRVRDYIQRRFQDQWDKEFEEDVLSGKLEHLGKQALAEHRSGQSRPFPRDAE